MYLTPAPDTTLYRAAPLNLNWHQILTGMGSYSGTPPQGRYHSPRQPTVYASPDPLVAITEGAFYEALDRQKKVGTTVLAHQHQLAPFLGRTYRLWAFRLNPPPTVIDLEDPMALQAFGHPPFVLRNPSSQFYLPTQQLIDAVFSHPANAQGQKAWGVKAPAVRTPRVRHYRPYQYVFILQPNQKRLPATALASWELEVEFLDLAGQPVTRHTSLVDWRRPRFRLVPRRGAAGAGIPAFAERPNATAYQPDQWYRARIVYA
jgi:hypothetical protein